MRYLTLVGIVLLLMCGVWGCTTPAASVVWTTQPAPEIKALEGYRVGVLVSDLNGPTQMALGPDGALWVAQLAGGEVSGQGQVLRITPEDGKRQVVLDGLYKPTGLAIIGDQVWVTAGAELLRANFDDNFKADTPEVMATLPDVGRSNGTLSITPNGHLLYAYSSLLEHTDLGTGKLWELDPSNPLSPTLVAQGFANPYAHDFDSEGRLWVVNMTEDVLAGETPPDALFLLPSTTAPSPCVFYEDPVTLFPEGVVPQECGETYQPIRFFLPHATPTGIVASPWEANTSLVSLWVVREVVTVSERSGEWSTTTFLTGFASPQDLLALPNGALLVSDHGTGKIYQVVKS